jgi:hypothetical protein
VQSVYIHKIERLDGERWAVDLETFETVKDR